MASNLASELSGTQVVELVSRLGRAGLSYGMVKNLMGNDEEMYEFVRKGLETIRYHAPIQYDQPSYIRLKQGFDWVYDGYSKAEFKTIDACRNVSTESRETWFELVYLNKNTTTSAVLAELARLELRPALYEELLGFAKQYPIEQCKYPIVALGSVCQEDELLCSPFLHALGRGRCLSFGWVDNDWNDGGYRFLAVRK